MLSDPSVSRDNHSEKNAPSVATRVSSDKDNPGRPDKGPGPITSIPEVSYGLLKNLSQRR